jgi:predicted O-methyltransferase YrrM
VPESLSTVEVDRVAYLSIDMNIAYPERKAIEHFWPKLAPGALVVLDDYGWMNYEEQKQTMDDFARGVGVEILTLPTGQGLLVKP